jgi:hypothetical protein
MGTERTVHHEVALWAAGAAFFGNLVGLKIIGQVSPLKVLGSLAVSGCVAGAVYCKQRLDEAKARKEKDDGRTQG